MTNNMSNINIAIIGASGGIGAAFTRLLAEDPKNTLHIFSRKKLDRKLDNVVTAYIDYADEESVALAAEQASTHKSLDLVIIATGILHDENMMPEKSLRDISAEKLERNFLVNSIGPALVAKYFLPTLNCHKRSVFAALSARVGSISDNRLGGWYGYRASKAALNMIIRTASVEVARRNKQSIVVGLHPGTVATALSEPFQARVPKGKLFTAEYSACKLINVIDQLTPGDSGKVFAWDGSVVPY